MIIQIRIAPRDQLYFPTILPYFHGLICFSYTKWNLDFASNLILAVICFLRSDQNSFPTPVKRCRCNNQRRSLWIDRSHKGSSIWLVYAGNVTSELIALIRDLRFDLSEQVMWPLLFTYVVWSYAKKLLHVVFPVLYICACIRTCIYTYIHDTLCTCVT